VPLHCEEEEHGSKHRLQRQQQPSIGAAAPHCTDTTFGRRITGVPSRRCLHHKQQETATMLPHSRQPSSPSPVHFLVRLHLHAEREQFTFGSK